MIEGMHGFGERRHWRNAPAEHGREQRLEAIDDVARRHRMLVSWNYLFVCSFMLFLFFSIEIMTLRYQM